MIFFAFLASLATLWEPLGLPIWQFSRSFSQFQQIFHKKTAPSYFVCKNTVIFSIFRAREHQKSLKIVEKPLFFQWFCWFHIFHIFSLSAPILGNFSMIFIWFAPWNDCEGTNLLPLGLSWVNLGTTFSFLGVILRLPDPQFLMQRLVSVTFSVTSDPPDAFQDRFFNNFDPNASKFE